MTSAVILLSGGLDSATLLWYAARRLGCARIHTLTFSYGQAHARETACADRLAREAGVEAHRRVDLPALAALAQGASVLLGPGAGVPALDELARSQRDQPPTYVPHRNLVLLSLAAAYAEAEGFADVCYGAQAQDAYGYWDCTPGFRERLNALLALNRRRRIRVRAPFMRWPKRRIVRLGLVLGVPYARTWTCYRGEAAPCRVCPSCRERRAAFAALGADDPLDA